MTMAMAVVTAAQQPHAYQVDQQADHGDRNRFAEVNRYRRHKARNCLVANQHRNHCKHDGTRKPCEVAELAGTEHEAGVRGMFARVGVREGRNQHSPGVSRHVQAVGDKRQRPEHTAADDFNQHHRAAQGNHGPRLALVLFVTGTKKNVVMPCAKCGVFEITHFLTLLT
jgi:hypothetical protein